jgi:transcriptional regulator with XRE-family HTH domain
MDESEVFRANLLAAVQARGLKAAELSRKAGLNARAVKDIEERRTVSPKLSTAFALARALGEDPGEMMGLGPRVLLRADLAAFLSRYDEADQARLLQALAALPSAPPEKP